MTASCRVLEAAEQPRIITFQSPRFTVGMRSFFPKKLSLVIAKHVLYCGQTAKSLIGLSRAHYSKKAWYLPVCSLANHDFVIHFSLESEGFFPLVCLPMLFKCVHVLLIVQARTLTQTVVKFAFGSCDSVLGNVLQRKILCPVA